MRKRNNQINIRLYDAELNKLKDIPIDDIETALSGCSDELHKGSSMKDIAPPNIKKHLARGAFLCFMLSIKGRVEKDGFAKQNAKLPVDVWQVRVRAGATSPVHPGLLSGYFPIEKIFLLCYDIYSKNYYFGNGGIIK